MNVSFSWLRAFVPFDQTPAELRDLLTSKVVTVDEVIPLRTDLAAIVVARVVEEGPHPDSDHLHVTKVDAGTGELLDVVCGDERHGHAERAQDREAQDSRHGLERHDLLGA
jgi:phenylalanyl-tRNA synthetase beta chain